MTGNVALDIFIGLVFVYLLYSLFATVILEIITCFERWVTQNVILIV
ncbi:hypothetical protein [Cyclobacterium roseum]|nr:hypothetical protein [Cyclobacterium roseum]